MDIPTIHGNKNLTIPPGTQSGQSFTLKAEGVPSLRGHGRGDMIIEVKVLTPTNLTKKQKELFKEFAALAGEETNGKIEGFFKKLFH
jgi:molecular chaperone DnaJ